MLNNIAKNSPLYSKLQLQNKDLTCGGNGKSTPVIIRRICESTGKVVCTVESIGKMYFNRKKIRDSIFFLLKYIFLRLETQSYSGYPRVHTD